MENVKKINDDLAVATEQLSPDLLKQAAQEYKSILNLRRSQVEGFLREILSSK